MVNPEGEDKNLLPIVAVTMLSKNRCVLGTAYLDLEVELVCLSGTEV